MVISSEKLTITTENVTSKKGGLRTLPFIIGFNNYLLSSYFSYSNILQIKLYICHNNIKYWDDYYLILGFYYYFCAANETFEKVASYGLLANMILYLMFEYHLKLTTGTNILFLWTALSNFTPIIGAFLSDSYLGRFRVVALGTITSLLVSKFLASTTYSHIYIYIYN